MKTADSALTFYRPPTDLLALEAVADSVSRAPGWALGSEADALYYFRLAIPMNEHELAELVRCDDDALVDGVVADNDDLLIVPMRPLAAWFSANLDRYPSRPVATSEGSGWYRLVPRGDVVGAIQGTRSVDSLLARIRD